MYWGFPCFQWFLRHGCILNQGPFVRKHQLWFYFDSLVSKIISLLVFTFPGLPDFCRLCCKCFLTCLSSRVFLAIYGGEGLVLWAPGDERGSNTGCESCIWMWNGTCSEHSQQALAKTKARINSDTSSSLASVFPSWAGCHSRGEEIH